MSRMHSTKKGKSGSTRPYRTAPPEWVEATPEDIEGQIVKMAKKGENPSMIGTILRDQQGVPSVKLITKKRVGQILEEKGVKAELPEDLTNLLKRIAELQRHRDANPKDMTAKRGWQLIEAKIKRLAKYYIREGRIPADWKFDINQAKFLVK